MKEKKGLLFLVIAVAYLVSPFDVLPGIPIDDIALLAAAAINYIKQSNTISG